MPQRKEEQLLERDSMEIYGEPKKSNCWLSGTEPSPDKSRVESPDTAGDC